MAEKRKSDEPGRWERDLFEVLWALRDIPDLPSPRVLSLLSVAGRHPDDWERGMAMQREYGLDAIPPNHECEVGAGVWQRLRTALSGKPQKEADNG